MGIDGQGSKNNIFCILVQVDSNGTNEVPLDANVKELQNCGFQGHLGASSSTSCTMWARPNRPVEASHGARPIPPCHWANAGCITSAVG
jgi:hypothetical protein